VRSSLWRYGLKLSSYLCHPLLHGWGDTSFLPCRAHGPSRVLSTMKIEDSPCPYICANGTPTISLNTRPRTAQRSLAPSLPIFTAQDERDRRTIDQEKCAHGAPQGSMETTGMQKPVTNSRSLTETSSSSSPKSSSTSPTAATMTTASNNGMVLAHGTSPSDLVSAAAKQVAKDLRDAARDWHRSWI